MSFYWDNFLFAKINGLAGQRGWLDWLVIFSAEYLQYFLIAGLLIFLFVGKSRVVLKKNRLMVFSALFAALVSRFVFTQIIKIIANRPRPFVFDAAVQLLLLRHEEAFRSFPSGHATFFFALAVSVFVFNKKAGYWFVSGAFLISLSRVFAGVHYPSDILAGAILGAIVGWLIAKLFKRYSVHGNGA